MTGLPELARKFSRAIECERGIRLEAADIALFVTIGVNDLVQAEAAKLLRDTCHDRTMREDPQQIPKPFTRAVDTDLSGTSDVTEVLEPRISRSSGTTQSQDVTEAAARAQRTLRRQKTSSTNSISSGSEVRPSALPVVSRSAPAVDIL